MTGLAGALLVFLVLGITGVVESRDDTIALIFLQFLGLVLAGFVAGRLARRDRALHGGYAGLSLFAVATALTLATSPGSASPFVIGFTGVLALVLGTAGGVLAGVRDD